MCQIQKHHFTFLLIVTDLALGCLITTAKEFFTDTFSDVQPIAHFYLEPKNTKNNQETPIPDKTLKSNKLRFGPLHQLTKKEISFDQKKKKPKKPHWKQILPTG